MGRPLVGERIGPLKPNKEELIPPLGAVVIGETTCMRNVRDN